MRNNRIVSVDFDGTCVTHEYPNVGLSIDEAMNGSRTDE